MDISIIIPVYNVEEYLVECLESVKSNIEKLRCEVFLIDDGSTDGSTDIAEFYAENCKEFSYYRMDNGGPGKVRNFGATLASGKYLYFMDADDILAEGALYKMFCMAERNHTDLTVCMVGRIQGKKVTPAGLHSRVFYNLKGNITHIRNHPNLVYDTISCDKLILRSFFVNNGFFYPEGYSYEDIPVTLQMHYCANGVSIIRYMGYLWRIRTGKDKQLTRILDKKALTDKIEMLTRSMNYICMNGKDPHILEAFQIKILDIDFEVYFDKLYMMDYKDAQEIIHLVAVFIEKHVDKKLISKLPLKKQQIIQDVLHEDLEHLIQVVNYKNSNYSKAPVVETTDGLEMVLPDKIFTIKNRGISNEFLNTPPNCFIDFVNAEDTKLRIYGHLYFWRVNIPIEQDQKIKACLLNEETGNTVPVEALPFQSPYLTAERGTLMNYDDYKFYKYDYNWAGFQINLDFNMLAQMDGLQGNNFILLRFENRICKGEVLVRGIKKAEKEQCERFLYSGKRIGGSIAFDCLDTIIVNFELIENFSKEEKKLLVKSAPKETLIIKTAKELKKNLVNLTNKLEAEQKNNRNLQAMLEAEQRSGRSLQEKLETEVRNSQRLMVQLQSEQKYVKNLKTEFNKDKKEFVKKNAQLLREKERLIKKTKVLEHKYDSVRESLSFKLGRAMTFIPRKIRELFRYCF